MPNKKIRLVPKEDAEEINYQKDLKELDQIICNIRAIIEAHTTEPIIESKDLIHTYFFNEVDNLKRMLNTPAGLSAISNQDMLVNSLTYELLLNKCKTNKSKNQIAQADDLTCHAWGEIRRKRKYGSTKPTTGLVEGPLKDFLKDFLAKKKESNNKNIQEIKFLGEKVVEKVSIGALKYENSSIYYNESRLDLLPQLVKLCKIFLYASQTTDTFVRDEIIINGISSKKLISKQNMEKKVSELRRKLKKVNRLIIIKRVNSEGYTFIAKDIR